MFNNYYTVTFMVSTGAANVLRAFQIATVEPLNMLHIERNLPLQQMCISYAQMTGMTFRAETLKIISVQRTEQ